MNLSNDQLKIVEQLAGINYTVRQIAIYFDISVNKLYREFRDKKSTFRYHYDRGKLISQADIDMNLQASAKGGNLTAQQQLEKIKSARHFENLRDQLINGY